ncbi:MAG: hypothetical protein DRH57_01210 [Candidatus Cloacimonadota bacterium]|nr:MAG: hypothetical protein DRH57_01210 [Candidatus Cloacimonadota bacterium]
MKKVIGLCLIIALAMWSCGKKAKKEEPKEKVSINVYYTQPAPFSKILSDLEKLGAVNFNRVLKNRKKASPKSLDKIAFNLGAEVADALVSVKGKNKNELISIANDLVNYGEMLGVSKKFLQLSDSLRILLEQDDWERIEKKLENYKKTILDELYSLENFDYVVLIQFGGWIKGLQNVSDVLIVDVKGKEGTKLLSNKTVINALLHDLPNLSDNNVLNQSYFQKSLANVRKIKEIIFGSKDEYFDEKEVKQLYQLSTEITELYLK